MIRYRGAGSPPCLVKLGPASAANGVNRRRSLVSDHQIRYGVQNLNPGRAIAATNLSTLDGNLAHGPHRVTEGGVTPNRPPVTSTKVSISSTASSGWIGLDSNQTQGAWRSFAIQLQHRTGLCRPQERSPPNPPPAIVRKDCRAPRHRSNPKRRSFRPAPPRGRERSGA